MHNVEKVKHQARPIVRGDKCAAPLLPNQDVFHHQFINGLAHRTDGHLEAFRQLPFRRDHATGLPFAAADGFRQQAFDFFVEGRVQRRAGGKLVVPRWVFPFAHKCRFPGWNGIIIARLW